MGRYRYQIFDTENTKARLKNINTLEKYRCFWYCTWPVHALSPDLQSLYSSGHHRRQWVVCSAPCVIEQDNDLVNNWNIFSIFDLSICVVDSARKYWTTTNVHSVRQPCTWSTRSRDLPVNLVTSQYWYRCRYRRKTSVSYSVSYRFEKIGIGPIHVLEWVE